MAICAKCGATLTDDTAAFCGICGARLPRPAAAPAGPTKIALSDNTVPDAPLFSSPASGASPAGAEPSSAPAAAEPPPAEPAEPVFKAPKHLPAGALVDKKYAVLRVLGEGGMGVVYLCRDIHTGLDVVIKAVRAELAHREDVRARTLAEGRALAQIDHPNVVQLRAVAVEGPHLYLVMQYIEGESLDKIIAGHAERGERMPVDEALAVFRQVVSGVAAAHGEGVIHRDLKPANVIVRRKDRVAKVTDFGIALVSGDAARPSTRGILGSLWYMSPEQVTGRPDLDHRVDVYALGIVLYQMLVGHVPFDAKTDYDIMRMQAEAPMPRLAAARADVPAAVDELVQRACAKDREARFQSCEEMIAALDRAAASAPAAATPATAPGTDVTAGLLLATPPPPPVSATIPASGPLPLPPRADPPVEVDLGPEIPVRRIWPWFLLAALLAGSGAGVAVALGVVPGIKGVVKQPRSGGTADAGAPRPTASATAAPGPPRSLVALAGSWVGNGRELTAVMVGSDLEFRVKKPDQFPRQGYEAGDTRFVLRATAEPLVFAVEDHIRPALPIGKLYDPRARGTCQEIWTAAAGDPLRARFEGGRLSVEFAKIEPITTNFTMEGLRVTSCVGLRDLKPTKVLSILARQ